MTKNRPPPTKSVKKQSKANYSKQLMRTSKELLDLSSKDLKKSVTKLAKTTKNNNIAKQKIKTLTSQIKNSKTRNTKNLKDKLKLAKSNQTKASRELKKSFEKHQELQLEHKKLKNICDIILKLDADWITIIKASKSIKGTVNSKITKSSNNVLELKRKPKKN